MRGTLRLVAFKLCGLARRDAIRGHEIEFSFSAGRQPYAMFFVAASKWAA